MNAVIPPPAPEPAVGLFQPASKLVLCKAAMTFSTVDIPPLAGLPGSGGRAVVTTFIGAHGFATSPVFHLLN